MGTVRNELVVLLGYSYTLSSLSKLIKNKKDALFVAGSPFCCELLEKLGHSYCTIEDYVNSDNQFEMGQNNYHIIEELFEKYEDAICQRLKDRGLSSYYTFGLATRYYFSIKRMMDCISVACLLGSSLSSKLSPVTTYIYSDGGDSINYVSGAVNYEFYEYLFVYSLKKAICAGKIFVNKSFKFPSLLNIKSRIINHAKYIRGLFWACSSLLVMFWTLVICRNKSLLFTRANYELSFLYPEIKKYDNFINAFIFNSKDFPVYALILLVKILGGRSPSRKERKLIENAMIVAISDLKLELPSVFWESLQETLRRVIRSSYLKNLLSFILGMTLAQKYPLKGAISASIASSTESAFLLGISMGGSKTFQYEHGLGPGYLYKKISSWTLKQSDYYICYSNSISKDLKVTDKLEAVAMGSFRLMDLRKKIQNVSVPLNLKRLNLLCVPMATLGYRAYYPETKGSDFYNYFLWKEILETIATFNIESNKCLSVYVKSSNFLGKEVDYFPHLKIRKGYRHVDIVSEGTFVDFLVKGDIFLIDNPETTLGEAMLTNKPIIFYYNKKYDFNDKMRFLIEKRVYLVKTQEELMQTLKKICSNYKECVREKLDNSFLTYNMQELKSTKYFLENYIL